MSPEQSGRMPSSCPMLLNRGIHMPAPRSAPFPESHIQPIWQWIGLSDGDPLATFYWRAQHVSRA
jgi:hypothetical protein